MKTPLYILAGAIFVATVAATPMTLPGQAVHASPSRAQDELKFLRGPVIEPRSVPEHNFDKAEDFPSPDESEDEQEPTDEVDNEAVPDVGESYQVVPEEEERGLFQGNDNGLDTDVATDDLDEVDKEEVLEYEFRQLRSEAKQVPVLNMLVNPLPVLETVTAPASTLTTTEPGDAVSSDSKPNLRRPESERDA